MGHANLATTQQYTHVSIGKLKEIHTATHPAARLKRDIDDKLLDTIANEVEEK